MADMALPPKAPSGPPGIDLSTLNEEERKLVARYGKLPLKKGPLHKTLQARKYFDSGDYALAKAGQADGTGTQHPQPESIPHVTSPTTSNGIGAHSGQLTGTSPTGTVSATPMKVSLRFSSHTASESKLIVPSGGEQESGLAKSETADPNSPMET